MSRVPDDSLPPRRPKKPAHPVDPELEPGMNTWQPSPKKGQGARPGSNAGSGSGPGAAAKSRSTTDPKPEPS
ncbi:hypothetical protein ACYOEI_10535, partial [Singulisphaera rosea]